VIHLVRHGRTEANAGGRLQGRLDLPIDELGRAQAAALVVALPRVDRVISSPSLRACQTAAALGLEFELDERWLEMDFGEFDGVVMNDLAPDLLRKWMTDADFAPVGGESLRMLAKRVHDACDELLMAARTQEIVVVTHATPIKVAMAWALGVDASIVWRSHIDPASITSVMVRDRGPALSSFNVVPRS
jgi:probable phosphoglycerate mutase